VRTELLYEIEREREERGDSKKEIDGEKNNISR